MAVKTKQSGSAAKENWPYGKKNYIIFALAILVIIIGFVTLGQGSMTLSPILLVIGFCVLIPMALIMKDDSVEETSSDDTD